jgi:hypothetical protein
MNSGMVPVGEERKMENFNAAAVLNAIKNPEVRDPWSMLDAFHTEKPMSLVEYAAQAVGYGDGDLELCRFHIESGVYKNSGVTFEQFASVVREVSA